MLNCSLAKVSKTMLKLFVVILSLAAIVVVAESSAECTTELVAQYGSLFAIPGSCGKFLACRAGKLEEQSCPTGMLFDVESSRCIDEKQAVCLTENWSAADGLCDSEELSVHPDPHDCARYVICLGEKVLPAHCRPGLLFDSANRHCEVPHNAVCNISCPSEDDEQVYLPDSTGQDCAKYYICKDGVSHPAECPSMMYFDLITKTCVLPDNASCRIKDVACLDQDEYVGNPNSCSSFYECEAGFPHFRECGTALEFIDGMCTFASGDCDGSSENATEIDPSTTDMPSTPETSTGSSTVSSTLSEPHTTTESSSTSDFTTESSTITSEESSTTSSATIESTIEITTTELPIVTETEQPTTGSSASTVTQSTSVPTTESSTVTDTTVTTTGTEEPSTVTDTAQPNTTEPSTTATQTEQPTTDTSEATVSTVTSNPTPESTTVTDISPTTLSTTESTIITDSTTASTATEAQSTTSVSTEEPSTVTSTEEPSTTESIPPSSTTESTTATQTEQPTTDTSEVTVPSTTSVPTTESTTVTDTTDVTTITTESTTATQTEQPTTDTSEATVSTVTSNPTTESTTVTTTEPTIITDSTTVSATTEAQSTTSVSTSTSATGATETSTLTPSTTASTEPPSTTTLHPPVDPAEMCKDVEIGVIPHPFNCYQYFMCIFGFGREVSCSDEQIFDPQSLLCVPGDRVTCTTTVGAQNNVRN